MQPEQIRDALTIAIRQSQEGLAEIMAIADSANEHNVLMSVGLRLADDTWTANDFRLVLSLFDDDGRPMAREYIRNRIGHFAPENFVGAF